MTNKSVQSITATLKIISFATTLFLLALLGGCGSAEHKLDIHSGTTFVTGTKVEVGKVSNETGQSYDIDIEKFLTDALVEELSEEKLLCTEQNAPKLLLKSKLVEYEKGNAFKRWLLPGWGTTIVNVQAELWKGDQLIGTEQARRTVSAGGAYTIGAWKTIFSSIADDIVDDLREKIPQ